MDDLNKFVDEKIVWAGLCDLYAHIIYYKEAEDEQSP